MGESSLANRVTLPDTSYTRELSRGVASRSFDGPLEAEYQRTRLQEDRTMIRVAAVLVLVSVGAWALARIGAPDTGSHAGEQATATAGNDDYVNIGIRIQFLNGSNNHRSRLVALNRGVDHAELDLGPAQAGVL